MKIYYNKSCDEFDGKDCYLICNIDTKEIFINLPNESFKMIERDDPYDGSENLSNEEYLDIYAKSRAFEPVVKIRRLNDNSLSEYKLIWCGDESYKINKDIIKNRLIESEKYLIKMAKQLIIPSSRYLSFIGKLNKLISKI